MKPSFARINLRWFNPVASINRRAFLAGMADFNPVLRAGVLPVIFLTVSAIALHLLVQPLRILFSLPGVLAYSLSLVALGAFALDRSVQIRYTGPDCAWWGITAGMMFWIATEIMVNTTVDQTPGLLPVLMIMVVALVISTLWKIVFPLGVKFFAITYMANWVMHFSLSIQKLLINQHAFFAYTYQWSGFISLAAFFFFTLWMFKAETKIQRIWAALGCWVSVLALLIIFFNIAA